MVRRYLYWSCFCCCCCLCSNEICIKHKRDFFFQLSIKKTFLCLFKITLLGHVVPGAQMSLQRPTNIARPSAQERLLLLSSFFPLGQHTKNFSFCHLLPLSRVPVITSSLLLAQIWRRMDTKFKARLGTQTQVHPGPRSGVFGCVGDALLEPPIWNKIASSASCTLWGNS